MTGNFKKIFAGIFLLWLVLVSFAAVFYWPQIQESFAALTGQGLSVRQAGVPVASTAAVTLEGGKNSREGFLWVDQTASQYIATLGEIHGARPGKNLIVYDGSNELGEVIVEQALGTVSYVRPAKASVDFAQNPGGYYRVVMK